MKLDTQYQARINEARKTAVGQFERFLQTRNEALAELASINLAVAVDFCCATEESADAAEAALSKLQNENDVSAIMDAMAEASRLFRNAAVAAALILGADSLMQGAT
jgi:hypothetical protein